MKMPSDYDDKKKKKKRINKLSDLMIDEVSLVDRGANPHASFVISKRAEEDQMSDEEQLEEESVGKADPDPSSVSVEGEEEEEEMDEAKKSYWSRLVSKLFNGEESTTSPVGDGNIADMDDVEKAGFPGMQMPYGQQQMGQPAPGPQNAMPPGVQGFPAPQGQMPGQMQAGPPLPPEVIQYIQQLEQALAAASQGTNQPSGEHQMEDDDVNPFGKSAEDLDDDEITFLEELSKSLEDEDTREAVNKAMEAVSKANERATEAETIAKAEREHRLNQEYIAKARAYTNLPVDAEEFGPVLKKLDETLSEDEQGIIEKVFNAANERVAAGGTFDEIGKRGIDGYEAVSKLDAEAKALVEKTEGLTMEQARTQILEQDPSLYDEFLQETGR